MISSCEVCSFSSVLLKSENKECAPADTSSVGFVGRIWSKVCSLVTIEDDAQKPSVNVQALRCIVKRFLLAKEWDEIAHLVPYFSSAPLSKATSRLIDTSVIATYEKIREIASYVFSCLPQRERRDLAEATPQQIAETPALFLTLLQTSYNYSVGMLSKDGKTDAASLVERGALLKNILPSLSFPRAIILANAHLSCVPKEIGALSQTEILDLSENALSSLPSTIGDLSKLTHLNLSGNALHRLPDPRKLKCLEMIDLSFNPLDKFPRRLAGLKKLQVITLDSDQAQKFSTAISCFRDKRKDCKIEIKDS
jgi:hypothetical protein